MGYVLKLGETEPPQGLQDAMTLGNQWQDILTDEFSTGRSGNEILARAQQRLKSLGSSTQYTPIP